MSNTAHSETSFPVYSDPVVDRLIASFFEGNKAGQIYRSLCIEDRRPLIIDHITLRCRDIDQRANLFLEKGYQDQDERVEYPDQGWWAKVYRKPGFPTLFIDQAYADARGEKNIIPQWVARFGEEVLHHTAVLVRDIESALEALSQRGVSFSGSIVGERHTRLRQIFTAAEARDGAAFSVLELTERNDYDGFYPESANQLMESSVVTQPVSSAEPEGSLRTNTTAFSL